MWTTLLGGAVVDGGPADWDGVEAVVDPTEVAGCVSRFAEGDSPSHPPIAIERRSASSNADPDADFCDSHHPIILRRVSRLLMLTVATFGRLEFSNLPIR